MIFLSLLMGVGPVCSVFQISSTTIRLFLDSVSIRTTIVFILGTQLLLRARLLSIQLLVFRDINFCLLILGALSLRVVVRFLFLTIWFRMSGIESQREPIDCSLLEGNLCLFAMFYLLL